MNPLDNPIWFALQGPQATFAEVRGPLRSYPEDVAPFSAFEERSAALDLALSSLERPVVLFRPSLEPAPEGWTLRHSGEVVQMVLEDSKHLEPSAAEVTRLEPLNRTAVRDLVALTQPGPFEARTMDLGRYVGVHREGRLVALAGERLRLDGYVEVSAVCTHPDARGRGYASALVSHLARCALAEGVTPFLHVMAHNDAAQRVYERLGFAERARLGLSVWVRDS